MDLIPIVKLQEKLLEWYDSNARILPWRDNPSPYRVWISEIMLQQTRVDTVKPYFERFMKTVPSIQELADISEDQLLKLWEGLGYYSRARNLKKAAVIIMQQFGGIVPADIKGLMSLPGIGPYTSGAIASIAYGIKTSAIDGNVLRVIARITANQGDIADPRVKNEIEAVVCSFLPEQRVGDFNQALMELGATICLPNKQPKCSSCPVQLFCNANQQDIAGLLPVKSKKKARKLEEKTIFVIDYMGNTAIRQRPAEGLLSSLWEFPNVEGHLSYEECEKILKQWGITASEITQMKASKHIFTHLEWHMIGYFVSARSIQGENQFLWATRKEIKERYSIPTAFKAYRDFLT